MPLMDTLTTEFEMAGFDLGKLTEGLSSVWAGYLRGWDRSLRSVNHPETTRYNYLLAAGQLARYLAEHSPDPDADDAADDPAEVTRDHVEAFQAWMIETRSAATAVNKHKARRIGQQGGVLVYLRGHEGRAIGLQKKLTAYELQDTGLDTVDANLHLGEPSDAREYGAAAAILRDLRVTKVQLLTNNPAKVKELEAGGVTVVDRLPLAVGAVPTNLHYLATKKTEWATCSTNARFPGTCDCWLVFQRKFAWSTARVKAVPSCSRLSNSALE
ncbi:hypothetical protein [Saccharopolyspora sp. NPDC049357]|uniref:hypothetical protein n=1 Tax=Saccharopolyspora sp. NPDC049357 TaxID=3154507 RepID=UPI0034476E9E